MTDQTILPISGSPRQRTAEIQRQSRSQARRVQRQSSSNQKLVSPLKNEAIRR